jgi:hypothetical protein
MEAMTISAEDRDRLLKFLCLVRGLMDAVLRKERFFSLEMHPLLNAAWDELLAEGRFERAEEAILSGNYDDALREHGLTGAQLEVKVVGAERTSTKAREGRIKRFLKKPWHQALEAANVALGSIALAVPLVGAVQEAKDITEVAIRERVTIGEQAVRLRRAIGRLGGGRPADTPDAPAGV